MSVQRLTEFVEGLQAHDGSTALAVLELLRRADESGVMERGQWCVAVRSGLHRLAGDHADAIVAGRAPAEDEQEADELARYLNEHVIGRLHAAGIATAEPSGAQWERVRIVPEVWQEVAPTREAIIADLEERVRGGQSAPAASGIQVIGAAQSGNGRGAGSTLSARGLVKVYRNRKVVNEVDLDVSQGEIVGLLGPNGAGKTTTFYMIVGLISPNDGKVYLDNSELTRVPMYRRARRGIGYLAQEPSIFRKLTVEQNIKAILQTLPISRAERNNRLERLLDELTIKHLRKAKAYSLSGGERRRLEITRALVSEPKFMLLDEPFAGVDPIAVHDIQQIVAGLRHRGIGVIITDHNVEQTLDIVDRAYIMYDGRVRVSGTVAELVWNEEVAEIYFGPTLTERMRNRYPRPEVA